MNEALPVVYLVRHADTAWTLTGQHTGRTDLPLTEQGERQARALGASLTALDARILLRFRGVDLAFVACAARP
jgi:probable phosphoglycerate mutase